MKEVVLGQDEVTQFKNKNDLSCKSLEEFILNDIAAALEGELYETTNNQFFNY